MAGLKKGVYAAAVTPMDPDGTPNLPHFLAHCRWLLANGCDGVAPLGTTGEANSIGFAQRLALIAAAGAELPADRLLFGVGACALADAVALTSAALAAGSTSVLALPPFYFKNPSDDGLFAFYSELIQRVGSSDLNLYLYHFPAHAAVPIRLPLIERLIKAYPTTVVGLKDSSGDWAHTKSICDAFPGFMTFAGTESLLTQCLEAGGAGCISASTNITAPLARQVFDAWSRGEDTSALQEALTKARLAIQSKPLIPGLKALTRRRTGDAIWRTMLPPNLPLSEAEEADLVALVAAAGFGS
ncbi:MAG: dihydrodipicolinate synthase family protein [Alphaproteobacteria bacterium]|nr:dihydrodipicolinate synthase family protein [Alphaproteobacteria bacterium]